MNKLLVDLEKLDVDVNKTLSRFMDNEELYLTFLYRFPNENKFNELKGKIENEEYDDCILVIAYFKGSDCESWYEWYLSSCL